MISLATCIWLALFLAAGTQAKYICDSTGAGSSYPFCISIPDVMPSDNCGGGLPMVISLSGEGGRGVTNDVTSHTTYDGFGLLLSRYRNGNTSAVTTMAATRFITVVPMATYVEPGSNNQQVYHYWRQNLDAVLATVKQRYGQYIDYNRVHCVGYSMGARGCWRYIEDRNTTFASSTSAGGGAESSGDNYLKLEPAVPTFPLLSNMRALPIRQYAGTLDPTAGTLIPNRTQSELVRVGSKTSSIIFHAVDHLGLQTSPFNLDLLSWLLNQKRTYTTACKPVSTSTKISLKRRHQRRSH